jgi:hypothetical protein
MAGAGTAGDASGASLVELLTEYDDAVPRIRAAFNPLDPGALVPELARIVGILEAAEGVASGLAGNQGAVRSAASNRNEAAAGKAEPISGPANSATDLHFHIAIELEDARAALARAARVVIDAVASSERITPGQEIELELTIWNGGRHPLEIEHLAPTLPPGWESTPPEQDRGGAVAGATGSSTRGAPAATNADATLLAPGALISRRFRLRAPADAEVTEPYYLHDAREGDIYRWPADVTLRGLPFEPPALHATARLAVAGAELTLRREVQYRAVSSTEGESRRPVLVAPPISVALHPAVAVLPASELHDSRKASGFKATTGFGPEHGAGVIPDSGPGAGSGAAPGQRDARTLHFSVQLATDAPSGIAGELRLELPSGWAANPATAPVRLEARGERRRFDFIVTPPSDAAPGRFPVRAVFTAEDGTRYDRGYELVDYPHIRPRPLYREALANVQLFDVRVAEGLHVAYIPGAADAIPEALAHLGVPVTIIEPTDLATADLSPFQTVVLGIRAYEHQPELPRQNRRLLEFVERGGTLIVQYNQYRFSGGGFAPYPLTIARPHDRVTDETAPVRLLDPTHLALAWPNRIGAADFEGWIQECGLYFARTWDNHFTPLLAMSDPGEDPLQGGLLVARHGKGTYVYTGLAFFRQLPAGVPGAYRLFANLVSLGVEE